VEAATLSKCYYLQPTSSWFIVSASSLFWDLKFSGPKGRAGSSPAPALHYQRFTTLRFHRYFLPAATFAQILTNFPGLRSAASTARLFPASVALPLGRLSRFVAHNVANGIKRLAGISRENAGLKNQPRKPRVGTILGQAPSRRCLNPSPRFNYPPSNRTISR
jgi:hypothetical protein